MKQGKEGAKQLEQLEKANELVSEIYKSILKHQTRYEARIDKMNKENKKRAKAKLKSQESQYKQAIKLMTKQYKEASKYMTKSEKQAQKLIIKNRVKDFRKLGTETEKIFDKMAEDAEDSAEKAKSKWEEFSDSIANMTAGISLADDFTNGIEEQSKSLKELKNSVMKQTGLNRETIKEMDKVYQNLVKEFDGLFNMSDMYEAAEYLASQGVKNSKDIVKYTKELKKIEAGSDLNMNQLDSLVQATQKTGVSMTTWANQIQALQSSGLQVNAESLVNAFDDNFQNIINKVGENNPEEFSKRMNKVFAATSAIEDSWGDTSGIFDLFESIKNMNAQEMGSNSELQQAFMMMGLQGTQLQSMINDGRIDEALLSVVKGVENAYAKYGNSAFMSNYVKSILGSSDLDQVKKLSSDTIANSVQTALGVLESTKSTDKLQEVADNSIKSWFETTMNKLKSTDLSLSLESFSNNTGIDGGDLLLGNALLGNPLGKLVGKLGGLFSTNGASTGLGATAKGALSGSGATLTTGLATLGGGSALVGGAGALGGLVGLGGLFSGAKDILSAFTEKDKARKSEKRWQGSTKLGMVGSGAAIGAGIGSVVPVLGTGVGALVGSGIGGLGALFSGDGVGSWLKDKWDGFTGIFKKDKSIDKATRDVLNLDGNTSATAKSVTKDLKSMEKGLKSLSSTASSASSSYSRSMSQMSSNTPSSVGGTSAATNPNSSQNGGKKNEFKWWNPFTWFNGSHKNGLDEVPFDGYRAILHEGEAVLTKSEAKDWRSMNKSFTNDSTGWFAGIIATAKATAKDNLKKFWDTQRAGLNSSSTGGVEGNTALGNINGNTQATAFKSMSNQQFIDWLGGVARDDYKTHKVLPSLTIAQGILESGWGKSGLTQKANNMFGIKVGSGWNGESYNVRTAEYTSGGGKYYIKDNFRKYPNAEQSVADHGALLNKSRYSKVLSARDYRQAAQEVRKAGYATDPNYPNTLISMIEKRKLYKFDENLPAYAQGTPWVPNDQVALLHKGEMVVPAEHNPINRIMKSTSKSDKPSADSNVVVDNSDVVDVIKWAVARLEAKIDSASNKAPNYRLADAPTKVSSRAREVFSF